MIEKNSEYRIYEDGEVIAEDDAGPFFRDGYDYTLVSVPQMVVEYIEDLALGK